MDDLDRGSLCLLCKFSLMKRKDDGLVLGVTMTSTPPWRYSRREGKRLISSETNYRARRCANQKHQKTHGRSLTEEFQTSNWFYETLHFCTYLTLLSGVSGLWGAAVIHLKTGWERLLRPRPSEPPGCLVGLARWRLGDRRLLGHGSPGSFQAHARLIIRTLVVKCANGG